MFEPTPDPIRFRPSYDALIKASFSEDYTNMSLLSSSVNDYDTESDTYVEFFEPKKTYGE